MTDNGNFGPHLLHTNNQQVVLVALSGPSSSGKSTTAKALNRLFEGSKVVHLDDFYFPDHEIPVDPNTNEQNWDCSDAIDFKKFVDYVSMLKSNNNLTTQIDSLEPEADLKLTDDEISHFKHVIDSYSHKLKDKVIVFVDGFMLFHDDRISSLFDIRLFFHAKYETLKSRRESRAGYNTESGFWVDPPEYFSRLVWPEYIKTHRHLFENEDVNLELNSHAKDNLKLHDIQNEDLTLHDLIDLSLLIILDRLE
mmetsp:Transcript_2296/g.2527  ORF Transcript_2296/g.2527 Transcript_2296/m.2527 type:complete len:252 (-) Transcript_2296:2482-3237(-)